MKKILGEDSSPSTDELFTGIFAESATRSADFLAFGHTSPCTYAEGTTARFLIRTRL